MRELGRLSWCSLSAVGAVLFLASANVSFAAPNHVCCDSTGFTCSAGGGPCSQDPCSAPLDNCGNSNAGCDPGPVGRCLIPGVGCQYMLASCMVALNCRLDPSCPLAPSPDESSDEPVCDEDEDRADTVEAAAEATSDRATWPITALFLFGLLLLPAAPMVLRRWNGRK